MLGLITDPSAKRKPSILCVGAHCDDIEIGCAGTLLVLQARGAVGKIDWLVISSTVRRQLEARKAMQLLVHPNYRGRLKFARFKDGCLPAHYRGVKAFFESAKRSLKPDLILCHERDDLHQDHRIVNEMVWNTFRDELVLEYEIPKWDGGLGQPNVYVPLSRTQLQTKVDVLISAYKSQQHRHWFSESTFLGIARLRGIECRSQSGFAEGFHGRKLRLVGL